MKEGRDIRHRLVSLASAMAVTVTALGLPVAVPGVADPASAASFGVPGFGETTVASGLDLPISVRFAKDGRMFVAEKAGVVKAFDSLLDATPTTVLDIRDEVIDFMDRGVLGIALDPQFTTNRPYLYVYYVYDAPLGQTAPVWNDACPNPPGYSVDGCVVSSKVVRYTIGADNVAVPASRLDLVHDWCQQFPSHSGGGIAFGPYGELYVSGGDGANYTTHDWGQFGGTLPTPQDPVTPINPCGDPVTLLTPGPDGAPRADPATSEGGALRSQDLWTPADPQGLAGTIIRINPDTGAAYASNPLAASADANRRRVVAYGFRNPFRMAFRPGTSELYVADVGSQYWEEINRIPIPINGGTVRNHGWPCYEGPYPTPWKDVGNSLCDTLYAANANSAPFYRYSHWEWQPPTGPCFEPDERGGMGAAPSGLAFYQGGSSPYPTRYQGALFFADYARDCIAVMLAGPDGLPDPTKVEVFLAGASFPVDLTTGPGGDLFYPDLVGGRIVRISYSPVPTARATATPSSGLAPLAVTLDGSASSDPSGTGITSWSWDIDGDGQYGGANDRSGAVVAHTFTVAKVHTVGLRVTNGAGLTDTTTVTVNAGNSLPVPKITAPLASLTWKVGDQIAFSGSATDAEDGALPASGLRWDLVMRHCAPTCHDHIVQSWSGVASGSFVGPEHEFPSYLVLRLRATDSDGGIGGTEISLYPRSTTVTLRSEPSGVPLSLGEASHITPATVSVILGTTTTVTAPATATIGGRAHSFAGWADGGPRVRSVTVNAPVSLTARYVPDAPDSCASATSSATGVWIGDQLAGGGDQDWFRFSLASRRVVVLTLGDLAVNGRLDLYSACGTLVATSDAAGTRWEEIVRTLPAGTYRARVSSPTGAGSETPYALRFRVMPGSGFGLKSTSLLRSGTNVRIVGEVMNLTGTTREAIKVTADFKDASGRVVQSLTASTFARRVANGGVTAFAIQGDVPAYATVSYRYTSSAPSTSALPTFSIGTVTSTAGPGGTATEKGTVRNTSTRTATGISVMRAWYGTRGQILELRTTALSPSTLGPGATGAFTITRPALTGFQASRTFVRGRY